MASDVPASPNLVEIESPERWELLECSKKGLAVMHFYESRAAESVQSLGQSRALSSQNESITFALVELEKVPEFFSKYRVEYNPTFLFFKDGKLLDRLVGFDPPALIGKIDRLVEVASKEVELFGRLKAMINSSSIVIFIKGTRDRPMCRFSRELLEILEKVGLPYMAFDILEDPSVRQGLKVYSDWPTYPQVYVNGVFIGGLDIIKQLREQGVLFDVLSGL